MPEPGQIYSRHAHLNYPEADRIEITEVLPGVFDYEETTILGTCNGVACAISLYLLLGCYDKVI
jgi:hypothetical protein